MSERQTTSACPHPEAVGRRWGDPISEERQTELQGYLDRWATESDHGRRKGPFDFGIGPDTAGHIPRVQLTGADVSWLAKQSGPGEYGQVPNLHLEEVNLEEAHLEGATLRAAHLEGVNLFAAHLEGALFRVAHLDRANLSAAHLEGAHLAGTELEGAILRSAHLAGAALAGANLEGASLTGALLDSKTILGGAQLDDKTQLGDIRWNGVGVVDLTHLNWPRVRTLGDEQRVRLHTTTVDHEVAVRAYRQLAAQLRAQGIYEVADRFLYRAQVLQRRVLRQQGRLYTSIGSWLLGLISGYGFKPGRSFITYLLVIVAFAAAFFAIGTGILSVGGHEAINSPVSALVFSVTSFHGRGFFPGGGLALDDPITILAAIEAIVGLLIEITFIATFTQRFFAR